MAFNDDDFPPSHYDPTLHPPPGRSHTLRPSPYTPDFVLSALCAAGFGKIDQDLITKEQFDAAVKGKGKADVPPPTSKQISSSKTGRIGPEHPPLGHPPRRGPEQWTDTQREKIPISRSKQI